MTNFDITFCTQFCVVGDCANSECPRALTEDRRLEALSQGIIRLSWGDMKADDCGFVPRGEQGK